MSFAKINDTKVYYEKKGTKGKPVVLLHGWGQNSQMMDYIATFLKKHFVVYNLDFPGFGKSEEPKQAWDIHDYCDLLKSFCNSQKIKNPILIGHSFGCRVALCFAHDNPVRKMVLTGAAGIKEKRNVEYYFKVYSYKLGKKILSIKGLNKYRDKLMKNAGSDDYKNTSGVMRGTFVKIVNEDLKPLLKDIDTPTLLVWGENDEAVNIKYGKQMEKLLQNATLVVFEKDNHFAYFNQGDRFNRVLDAYLKEDY